MNKLLLLLLCLAVTLTSCSDGGAPAPDNMQADHKYTYLALGDSYTIGEGIPATGQWGVQLAELLRADGVDVANPEVIARTGWTTGDLIQAIANANLEAKYDMVSLLIGVNNQYRGQSLETYRGEFRELLQTATRLAKGDPENVLVLSIPDWGATPFARNQNREQIAAQIDAFNAVAREEAAKAGISVVDVTQLSREAVSDLSYVAGDGLHYSGKMYRQWALLALPEAKEILQ